MDPNEVLKRCRAARNAAARWRNSKVNSAAVLDALEEFEEAFDALDTWLVRGGFLPRDWERKP